MKHKVPDPRRSDQVSTDKSDHSFSAETAIVLGILLYALQCKNEPIVFHSRASDHNQNVFNSGCEPATQLA